MVFSGVNIWRWNELQCHLNMNNVRDWLEGKFRTNMVLLIWHLVNCCTVGTVLGGGDCRVADYWVILLRSLGSDSHQSWEVESMEWL